MPSSRAAGSQAALCRSQVSTARRSSWPSGSAMSGRSRRSAAAATSARASSPSSGSLPRSITSAVGHGRVRGGPVRSGRRAARCRLRSSRPDARQTTGAIAGRPATRSPLRDRGSARRRQRSRRASGRPARRCRRQRPGRSAHARAHRVRRPDRPDLQHPQRRLGEPTPRDGEHSTGGGPGRRTRASSSSSAFRVSRDSCWRAASSTANSASATALVITAVAAVVGRGSRSPPPARRAARAADPGSAD